MNNIKGQGVKGRTLPAVRLGLKHILHPLPNSSWRCFCRVSRSLHTCDITHTATAHCLCFQINHSGSLWKTKDMSYPGKVSNWETVNISLCVKNHPLHSRKHLAGTKCTQRDTSLQNYFVTDADPNRNPPFLQAAASLSNLLLTDNSEHWEEPPSWCLCGPACPWHDPGLFHSPKISFMSISFMMEYLTSIRNLAHVA